MVFLASLIFCVLFWAVEPGLMAVAKLLPGMPYRISLATLNGGLYGMILLAVRAGRTFYEDFRIGEKEAQGVRVREWLEVNRCRWLNVLGLVGISTGAALVFLTGRLPFAFWFLYAAIIVGLLDVIKRNRLITVKSDFPAPRFDVNAATLLPEGQGRKVEFRWRLWSEAGAPAEDFTASFTIDTKEYQQARDRPRLPADTPENYLSYVRDEFPPSVQQIAAHLRHLSEEREFSVLQEVANVICFVRSIPYAGDEVTHYGAEYIRCPIETLADQVGDCEDHAILAACLLYYLGHDVGLFFLKFAQGDHVAMGCCTREGAGPFSARASNGNEYYYVETVPTSESQQIGEISSEFLQRMTHCQVLPVE